MNYILIFVVKFNKQLHYNNNCMRMRMPLHNYILPIFFLSIGYQEQIMHNSRLPWAVCCASRRVDTDSVGFHDDADRSHCTCWSPAGRWVGALARPPDRLSALAADSGHANPSTAFARANPDVMQLDGSKPG